MIANNQKPKAIFILGNFGVGKSTILKKLHNPNSQTNNFLCQIKQEHEGTITPNSFILGTKPDGADSLSDKKKSEVYKKVLSLYPKPNIFIVGVYYSSMTEIEMLVKNGYEPLFVFLETSKKNNILRIKGRNKNSKLNEATWATRHNTLLRLKDYLTAKGHNYYEIDNNQEENTVFQEFLKILAKIQFT